MIIVIMKSFEVSRWWKPLEKQRLFEDGSRNFNMQVHQSLLLVMIANV